jgi:nucleotide-binding universal stress UspA family protein
LAAILDRAGAQTDDSKIHVLEGDPAFEIGALARRVHADAIVLGPHRERQPGARALGSTALAVVTNAASPCMVVSTPIRLPLRRVIVPIDLSDTARGALLVGLSWASALRGGPRENPEHPDVDLTVLYVRKDSRGADASSQPQALDRELEYVRKESGTWAGVSIHGQTIARTDAAQGIVDYVRDNPCDLVVMGTRGLGLDPVGRLGSVAASVIKEIAAPALLVPPAVWSAHARMS